MYYSYFVVTTDCLCAPHYKLLISKKKKSDLVVKLTKFESKSLLTLFFFSFLFFYLLSWEVGLEFGVTVILYCHKSHDTVTVTVTDYKIAIKRSRRFWKNDIIQHV